MLQTKRASRVEGGRLAGRHHTLVYGLVTLFSVLFTVWREYMVTVCSVFPPAWF